MQCSRCGALADVFMEKWCSVVMIGREIPIRDDWWLEHRGAVGKAVATRPCGPDMVFCDTGHPDGTETVVRLT